MSIPNMDITSRTLLGSRLILSSSYFQSGSSDLISAEGNKLSKIVIGVSNKVLSVSVIDKTNTLINETIAAMTSIQNGIKKEIAAGTHMHNTKDW